MQSPIPSPALQRQAKNDYNSYSITKPFKLDTKALDTGWKRNRGAMLKDVCKRPRKMRFPTMALFLPLVFGVEQPPKGESNDFPLRICLLEDYYESLIIGSISSSVRCFDDSALLDGAIADYENLATDIDGCLNLKVATTASSSSSGPAYCILTDITATTDGDPSSSTAYMPSLVETFRSTGVESSYRFDATATVYRYQDRVGIGDRTGLGCGARFLPDALIDFEEIILPFTNSCNNHSLCWESCVASKDACDFEFKSNMLTSCAVLSLQDSSFDHEECMAKANVVYSAVQSLPGNADYEKAQIKGGCTSGVRESFSLEVSVNAKEGGRYEPLVGAKVQCFAKKSGVTDAPLASGITGDYGLVEFDSVSVDDNAANIEYYLIIDYLQQESFNDTDWFELISDYEPSPDHLAVYCLIGGDEVNTAIGGFHYILTNTTQGLVRELKAYSELSNAPELENIPLYKYMSGITEVSDPVMLGQNVPFFVIVYPNRVERGDGGSIVGCGLKFLPEWALELSETVLPFDSSCNNHDLCWENCHESQDACDDEFRANMFANCTMLSQAGLVDNISMCELKAETMFTAVDTPSGEIMHHISQQKSNCPISSGLCCELVGEYFKYIEESFVKQMKTNATDKLMEGAPCSYLPIDQSDPLLSFQYYVSQDPVELQENVRFGLFFAMKCTVDNLFWDTNFPAVPLFNMVPNVDLDILLGKDVLQEESNPFLDGEPVNACCNAEDMFDEWCEFMLSQLPTLGNKAFDDLFPLSCVEGSALNLPDDIYMHCVDSKTCDRCQVDESGSADPCTDCKPASHSCVSSSECCQYSDNRDIVFVCDKKVVGGKVAETGVCRIKQIIHEESSTMCFAWNDFEMDEDQLDTVEEGQLDTVAFSFRNGVLPFDVAPEYFCEHYDGFVIWSTIVLTTTFKLIGLGISSEGRLAFGKSAWARSMNYGDIVPPVWDGFLSRSLSLRPGIDYWTSFRFEVQPTPLWEAGKETCKTGVSKLPLLSKQVNQLLQLRLDFELYDDSGGGGCGRGTNAAPCAIVAMPSATINLINFQFRIARGIGGYCRNATPDRCSPSGFFLNIDPVFEAGDMFTANTLGFIFSGFDAAVEFKSETNGGLAGSSVDTGIEEGGASFGMVLDDSSGEVQSVVFRLLTPKLEIFGFPVTPTFFTHFQWFKLSELERRRWTLLRTKDGAANCPNTVADCLVWKEYVGYEQDGIIDWEICEDRLFDLDQYNSIMIALDSATDIAYPKRFNSDNSPEAWSVNPKYYLSDKAESNVLVVYVGVPKWDTGLVVMEDMALVVISILDEEDVYISVELDISVLCIAELKAAASIQNIVGARDKWVFAFAVEAKLSDSFSFAVQGRSDTFEWDELSRRRMLEEAQDEKHRQRLLERRLATPEIAGWDLDVKVDLNLKQVMQEALTSVMNDIRSVTKAISDEARYLLQYTVDVINSAETLVKEAFKEACQFVDNLLEDPSKSIEDINMDQISFEFQKGRDAVASSLNKGWDALKDLAGKSFLELEESFGDVFEDAKCIGQKISREGCNEYRLNDWSCCDDYGCRKRDKHQRKCWIEDCSGSKRVCPPKPSCYKIKLRFWKKTVCPPRPPCFDVPYAYPCEKCSDWEYHSLGERDLECIEKEAEQASALDASLEKAAYLRNLIDHNNVYNIKGLKHTVEQDSLDGAIVGFDFIPVNNSFAVSGRDLPILRPNSTEPSLENTQLGNFTFDFLATKDPVKMEAALAEMLKGSVQDQMLRDINLDKDFLAFRPENTSSIVFVEDYETAEEEEDTSDLGPNERLLRRR